MSASLRWSVICVCVALTSAGCSDGGSDAGGSSGAAGAAGQSSAGSSGTGAQAGSATAGESAAGGSGGAVLAPLVPLIAGRESKFEFTPIDASLPVADTCEEPTALVEGPKTIAGYSGVLYYSPCALQPYLLQGSGDALLAAVVQADGTLKMPASEYIHSPVEDGEEWFVNGGARTWKAVDATITTPAGEFAEGCWEMQAEAGKSLFYCRGVGLVRIIDAKSNTELSLISKNF